MIKSTVQGFITWPSVTVYDMKKPGIQFHTKPACPVSLTRLWNHSMVYGNSATCLARLMATVTSR